MSGLNLYESTAADLAYVTARLQKAIDLATAYRKSEEWAEACNGVHDGPDHDDLMVAVAKRRMILRELLDLLA